MSIEQELKNINKTLKDIKQALKQEDEKWYDITTQVHLKIIIKKMKEKNKGTVETIYYDGIFSRYLVSSSFIDACLNELEMPYTVSDFIRFLKDQYQYVGEEDLEIKNRYIGRGKWSNGIMLKDKDYKKIFEEE